MTPEQIEAYVDAAAAALGLALTAGQRPGVLRYFSLAAGFAATIDKVPLEGHHEPALVFEPVSPPASPETSAPARAGS